MHSPPAAAAHRSSKASTRRCSRRQSARGIRSECHGEVPRGDHRVDSPRLTDRDHSLGAGPPPESLPLSRLFLAASRKPSASCGPRQGLTEIGLALLLREFPASSSAAPDLVGDPVAAAGPIPDRKRAALTGRLMGSDNRGSKSSGSAWALRPEPPVAGLAVRRRVPGRLPPSAPGCTAEGLGLQCCPAIRSPPTCIMRDDSPTRPRQIAVEYYGKQQRRNHGEHDAHRDQRKARVRIYRHPRQ